MTRVDGHLPPYRVFIVDDHSLVRQVLKKILNNEPSLKVVGEASSGEEALITLAGLTPDIVLVDFSMSGMSGAELIRQLQDTHPQTRCLVVSSHNERYYVDTSLAAGALGYVVKGDSDILIRAIARVMAGQTVTELA